MDKKNNQIESMLNKFKERLNKRLKVNMLLLFGSRARGDSKEGSDVDIIIVSKAFEGVKYHKRSPQFYMMWNFPYDVDILCLTPKELELKKKQLGVVQEAMKEGIEI